MVIRDVLPSEHAAVGELVVDVYRSIIPGLDDYADELHDIARRIEAGVLVCVAEVDGALAGTVSYVPGWDHTRSSKIPEAPGYACWPCCLHSSGAGSGRHWCRTCLDRARVDRRERVYLDTTEWMDAAQRLYLRIGSARAPELDWEPTPGLTLFSYVYQLA